MTFQGFAVLVFRDYTQSKSQYVYPLITIPELRIFKKALRCGGVVG